MRCTGTKPDGTPCANVATVGRKTCRWHSRRPADIRARLAASKRGGEAKAYGSLRAVAPIGAIDTTELETLAGLRRLLAGTLAKLAELPTDVRLGTALGQIATAQRALIEGSDIEARLAALEAAQTTGPRRVG